MNRNGALLYDPIEVCITIGARKCHSREDVVLVVIDDELGLPEGEQRHLIVFGIGFGVVR